MGFSRRGGDVGGLSRLGSGLEPVELRSAAARAVRASFAELDRLEVGASYRSVIHAVAIAEKTAPFSSECFFENTFLLAKVPHIRGHKEKQFMDETRRTRAACGATDPRGADEGDTRRESGCGLPRSADHVHNGPRNAGSGDKTAKRGRYRHRIPGQYTEWNAMHTHAQAQAVGGCKISPPVAIPLAPGRKTTGTAEFLHGSLWKESQFCRLPKQQEQRGSPQGQDSENDGKAVG